MYIEDLMIIFNKVVAAVGNSFLLQSTIVF